MTATNHALAGAIIGASIGNPVIALPLALISHIALDVLPHFGWKDHTSRFFIGVLAADVILGLSLLIWVLLIMPVNWPMIILTALVAASPDALWAKFWLADIKRVDRPQPSMLEHFLKKIQWGEFKWGLLVEVPFAIAMFVTLVNITQI